MSSDNVGSGNYLVKDGDCMSSVAYEHQFFWQTLWDLPENDELKEFRKDPFVLLPGDRIYIPAPRENEIPCPTNQRHRFVLKGVPERLKLAIVDDDDQPVCGQPYILEVDDKLKFQGQTDGSGRIDQPIPPNAIRGHLVVGADPNKREYYLKLGSLNPLDQISGLQARLRGLGLYGGAIDGHFDNETLVALMLFQANYQLTVTGENDTATQNKLKELYGS